MSASPHYSVMLNEVVETIAPKDGGVYVDGTFGAGGYTRALLEAADCVVYAIDRDASAMQFAGAFEDDFGERFVFLQGCFGDVKSLLAGAGVKKVDGFVLDIGVSSMQLDRAERGFSFRENGPLDMRMDTSSGQTAADIVNSYEENALADLIYLYGEERKSRWVAKKIVEARKEKRFETTFELADVVRSAVPKGKDKIDPATRTFQALRIAVNDELGELERALEASIDILSDEGRLVVVSFHSLEDRIVKQFMKRYSETEARGSRHFPDMSSHSETLFSLFSRKAIKPTDYEISKNARSRSAKMRAAIRRDNVEVPHA
ncbi:MAG: 16S rRNA (cytosine(1402)-N(4))-methyltransferase RsmH [Alphaproteobacteria bacterium]|nr:16S rRNA (cytosine(1402)-N(4))-methyltransferase RsmH [Alphaproteobacteria bacterium]